MAKNLEPTTYRDLMKIGMARLPILHQQLPDESVDLPYSGRAIQKFVREKLKLHGTKKIGFIAPMTGKIDGYYHIRGFASRDD